jgi:hypothetical protein
MSDSSRVVSKIDEGGFYVEDVLLEDGQALPESCVEERPQEGFHAPRWAGSQWTEGKPSAEIFEEAKAQKEAELRDAATGWYETNIRSFEGSIVVAKYGRSGLTALNAEERVVFDGMNASYTRLKGLIVQVRGATTVAEVEDIRWS